MSNRAINILEEKIRDLETIILQDGATDELINEKKDCVKAIKMIKFIEKNEIDIKKRVLTLPYIKGHGYYAYRLMIDNEVDDVKNWMVVDEINGSVAEFIHGDKIITS